MSRKSLTQLTVDRMAKPASGRLEIFDTNLPGFGIRVTAKGAKSWVVLYRVRGRSKIERITIGSLAEYPKVDEVRSEARTILQQAGRGEDPKVARRTPDRPLDTVRIVAEEFIKRHAKPKNRDWKGTERILKNHVLPRWGDRKIQSIGRRDVIELLDAVKDKGSEPAKPKKRKVGGPIAANRTLSAISKLFNWAIGRGIIDMTPVAKVEPPGKEKRRERYLSDVELRVVWEALHKMDYPVAPYFKLLILTGQRREEVAGIRWDQIDEEAKTWAIPSRSTKADRSHLIPLSDFALEALKEAKKIGAHVFTTRQDKPVSGYSKIKAAVDAKVAEICTEEKWTAPEHWTIHDLRRTCATGMGRLKINRFTIGRVLNHADDSVTAIYDQYEYLEEKRHALEAWGFHVKSLVTRPPANGGEPGA